MRVMIAGADYTTLSRLDSYLTNLGHDTVSVRNGLECHAGLSRFVPDLVVLELDIFWSGYDGVMATLLDNAHTEKIPVVFFTDVHKQLPKELCANIIVRIGHPLQSQELFRLRDLLENMELASVGTSLLDNEVGLAVTYEHMVS